MNMPCFLEDIYPENLLYAITIRSPIAKGYMKFIEYPKLTGNYTLITARNIPGENRLEDTTIPILADSALSYIGEPVALLVGQDKTKLEEYAAQCKVFVDEEEPVFLYGEAGSSSILAAREIQTGDPQGVFDKAQNIVRGSYTTGIQEHWYAEPMGAVTWFEQEKRKKTGKGKKHEKALVVRTATQWPYHVKRSLVRALDIDPSVLFVDPASISLHMDGKLWYPSLLACHAALGTLITNMPVRLVLNREEDFFYSPKRCESLINISSALDEKRKITGAEIDIAVNLGAFWVNSEEILDQACLGCLSSYQFDNLKLSARAVRTNIPPQGPFSGFGLSQGFFAMERHVSQIADGIKQDPAGWRKNFFNAGKILPSAFSETNALDFLDRLNTGQVLDQGLSLTEQDAAKELIDTVAKTSDYYRKWASYELLRLGRRERSLLDEKGENFRGIGIALGCQGNGLLYQGGDAGSYSIDVTLTKESKLEIKTSMARSNNNIDTIWAATAAEILSIEPDMVQIISEGAPDSGPSCASRNITILSQLVEKCCHAIRKKRFRDPLPITVRRSVKPQSGALWEGRFTPPPGKVMDISGFTKPGRAAAVVEVAIDPVDSIPKIRGVWLGIDGGKIMSPDGAVKSLNCGAAQALGWAFAENLEYTGGFLPAHQYNNYAISDPSGIPPIHIDFFAGDSREPKGIGELPFTCIPAAFLQAVSQAMDQVFNSIPLKREDIWEAMKKKKDAHSP